MFMFMFMFMFMCLMEWFKVGYGEKRENEWGSVSNIHLGIKDMCWSEGFELNI